MGADDITLKLTHDQALVLFEYLAQTDEEPGPRLPSEDIVLWKLEGQLESILVEPFSPKYADLLAEARKNVEVNQAPGEGAKE